MTQAVIMGGAMVSSGDSTGKIQRIIDTDRKTAFGA